MGGEGGGRGREREGASKRTHAGADEQAHSRLSSFSFKDTNPVVEVPLMTISKLTTSKGPTSKHHRTGG